MRYLTDRKRAVGKGLAQRDRASLVHADVSVALAFLLPVWVYHLRPCPRRKPAEAVVATFARPFTGHSDRAGAVRIGMRHFAKGAQMMIEDYSPGHHPQGAGDRRDCAFLRGDRDGAVRP
jgi:succinate dehydrogenase / fumarate reductase, membrane anchor subunit